MEGSQTQQTEIVSLNALYRGGRALMQLDKAPEDGQVVLVEVDRLKKGRYQKREVTRESVRPLAETIRPGGLINPVIVRMVGEALELIGGHRRTESFKLLRDEAKTPEERAKWERIPCIVRMGLTDLQVASLAAVDNLERDDGSLLEQGLSLLEVKQVGGFTNNAQVAQATGMSAQRVTRLIRLAESPEVIQQAVTPGLMVEITDREGAVRKERRKLELTVALAAFALFNHVERVKNQDVARHRTEKLLARAATSGWTRAQIEAEVKRLTGGRFGTAPPEDGDREPTDPGASDATPQDEATKRLLYRDRGIQWVLYTSNIARAEPDELRRLLERLRGFVSEVEARLESSNHR